MTYATTTMSICVAHNNLSAIIDHYDTHNNLCLTIMDTLEAGNNLSTVTDLNTNLKLNAID